MRKGLVALVVLLVIGALAGIKWSQIATLIAYAEDAERQGPPPETVGTAIAGEQVWEETLDAVGTVASRRDVEIRSEVPGLVTRIAFASGDEVRAGDVLAQLDSRVELAELDGALADERLARVTAERTRELAARGVAAASERDAADATLSSAAARVASLRATIAKKTIRAPFAGRVGIRDVNPGEVVEAGRTIITIGGEGGVFVDFTLPQEALAALSPGMSVRVRLDDARSFEATLAALEPNVEASTRAVGLRAEVQDGDSPLRPGMFVHVEVVLPERATVVAVPATAIVHAPYGDSVFLVEERSGREPGARETPDGRPIRTARQAFVQVGTRRGDFIAIREGVEAGREVVSAGAFKLRNGSPIVVDPSAATSAELDPRPESR